MGYSYSRSVTVRAYGFLVAFSAWALYYGQGLTGTGSALMVLIASSVIALIFLIWWRKPGLWIEFGAVAILIGIFYPIVFNVGQQLESQVSRDALMVGSFALGALLVFGKVPQRWLGRTQE